MPGHVEERCVSRVWLCVCVIVSCVYVCVCHTRTVILDVVPSRLTLRLSTRSRRVLSPRVIP